MRSFLLAFILFFFLTNAASARIWRPVGKAPVTGEFLDVQGDTVRIQTAGGITEIAYLTLSRTDKAVVKSSLQSQGKTDVANRLNNLEKGQSSTGSGAGSMPSVPGFSGTNPNPRVRVWRDISGQQLEAEFVGVSGPHVQLRVNGIVQEFPIIGFSPADQQWIHEHQNDTPQIGSPGSSGAMPPAGSGPGAMPGMPPGIPGIPPHMPGMPPSGMPGMRPGFPMPGAPGIGMMPPGMPGMPDTSPAPGSNQMPAAGPNFDGPPDDAFPGMSGPPQFPQPTIPERRLPDPPQFTPPPMPDLPGFSRNNDVLTCENCGAEFTEADGLKEGDDCPKCSGGGGFRFRSTRGLVKGVAFLAMLVIGAVGWVIKKFTGSN